MTRFCATVFLLACTLPARAAEQTALREGSMFEHYLAMLPALIFIVLLIIGLAVLVRRYSPALGSASIMLRVLASLSLGGKERIVLVQAGQEVLLLGVSPGRVQALHILDKADKDSILAAGVHAPGAATAGFAAILQNFSRKY